MICSRCLARLQAPQAWRRSLRRSVNTLANPRPSPAADHEGPPAATSTGAAQPLSNPHTPSPDAKAVAQKQRAPSSVPAGTILTGINYMKNKDDPVALEDHEYPGWLWTLLDKKPDAVTGAVATEGDAYAKSKKQRKIAARAAKKAAKENPEALVPKVPLDHQTIDLPAGDGSVEGATEAEAARGDLTEAMRKRRRHSIKEANYLKGMR